MNLKLAALGLATGVTAVSAAFIHAYLEVMYKESIPKGPIKIFASVSDVEDMDELGKFTLKNREWADAQDIEKIDLMSDRGYNLKGYYLKAEKESKVFVLFAHGYRADHNGDPINFVKYYHDKGYNFFSVDHTTTGESGGNFVGFDYFESIDMLKWTEYLIERFGEDISIILHGVSMGGSTVCKMADQIPKQVKLIISDCAFTSATDEFDATLKNAGMPRTKEILSMFNFLNRHLAGFDYELTNVRPNILGARVPMLFVHGGNDDFVPTRMAYELYDLCPTEKELFIVEGAGHAESIRVGTSEYMAKLDEFIGKYL